jgi:hypothetical protein
VKPVQIRIDRAYEALPSSAREIFSREGCGTSVREIAATAGVTKPGSAKPAVKNAGGVEERTMKRLILFSSLLGFALFSPYYGWTQGTKEIHTPVITHAYAIDKGRYGTIWKIYIEAEDRSATRDRERRKG